MLKWLKLEKDVFDGEKLSRAGAFGRVVLLELLALAGRYCSDETFIIHRVVPYSEEWLADKLHTTVKDLQETIGVLRSLDMVHAQTGYSMVGANMLIKPIEDSDEKKEQDRGEIRSRVISHLNETCGTHFRPNVKNTAGHINARLDEGFKLDDFIAVIDSKAKQWLGDERMEKYLRPETLFSGKFDRYLNEAMNAKSKPKPIPEEEERKVGMTDEEWDNL